MLYPILGNDTGSWTISMARAARGHGHFRGHMFVVSAATVKAPQDPGSMTDAGGRMQRTLATYTLYTVLGCLGYLLTGLGVVLPQLRAELHVSRAEVALYPSAFSLGLVIVGLIGDRLVTLVGRRSLAVSIAACSVGVTLLGAGFSRYASGAGALLLGIGGAGVFFLLPLALRYRHPDHTAVALSEGHGFSSAASVIVPLAVAGAIASGAGWRVGYVVPPVAVIVILLALGERRGLLAIADTPYFSRPDEERAPRGFAACWFNVLLVVIGEFCMVFWSTDFLKTDRAVHFGPAAAIASMLVLGMATGRGLSHPVARLIRSPGRTLTLSAVTALVGFTLLWSIDNLVAAASGLLLTGLGLALLYPITLSQAIETWPQARDRASARCALASGVAILTATLGLGRLADQFGLNTAMLLMPTAVAVFLVRQVMARLCVKAADA